jgi:hypothetical protein
MGRAQRASSLRRRDLALALALVFVTRCRASTSCVNLAGEVAGRAAGKVADDLAAGHAIERSPIVTSAAPNVGTFRGTIVEASWPAIVSRSWRDRGTLRGTPREATPGAIGGRDSGAPDFPDPGRRGCPGEVW